MAIDWEKLKKKAKEDDAKDSAKAIQSRSNAAQRKSNPLILPNSVKSSNTGASFGVLPKGHNVSADIETFKKPSTPPSHFERMNRMGLGAVESSAGDFVNALDWAAKVPGTPLWGLKKINDLVIPDAMGKAADYLSEKGSANMTRAKQGTSGLGSLGIDVGAGAIQLAGDMAAAAATGGGSIAPMVARSFGGAAKQAEDNGGSELEQAVYGGLTAATSGLVGKLTNVGKVLSKTYGKGVLDETLQKATSSAINKLIKNGVISDKVATTIAAGLGEGFEESLESTLSPLYQKITYNPDANYDAETVSGILYDGLIGAIIGGLAGGAGGSNYQAQTQTQNIEQSMPKSTINTQNTAAQTAQQPTSNVNPISGQTILPNIATQQNATQDITKGMPNVNTQQTLPQGTGAMSTDFAPQEKVSDFYKNTLQNTDTLTDEQKSNLNERDYVFDSVSEKQSVELAKQRLAVDFDGEVEALQNAETYTAAEDVDTAMGVLEKYADENNAEAIASWSRNMYKKIHGAAVSLQALDKYSRTPEGAVIKAQKIVYEAEQKLTTKKELGTTVNKALGRKISEDVETVKEIVTKLQNGESIQGLGKKLNKTKLKNVQDFALKGNLNEDAINEFVKSEYGMPALTAADVQKIYEFSKLAEEQTDDYQRRVFENRAARVIANRLPTTVKNKVLAVRRISMLLNPKTLISRNAGGNAVFGLLEDIKDLPGTGIDMLVSLKTGRRETSFNPFATAKAEYTGFKKGLTEWGKDVKNGVDTSPTQHEMPQASSFKGKLGRGVEETLNKLLQLGDRPFFEAAYAKRIDEMRRLGKDINTTEAAEQATAYALDRVFQNDSDLAQKAFKMRESLGVFGDIAMPFVQTPANIFDKLADYSPIGFVRAIKKFGSVGDSGWSQKQFTDTLARSMTGTGIILLGYFGFLNGLLTGGYDDEKSEEERYQDKVSGKLPYSVRVGDTSYTYDWAAPAGSLLALGADMAQSGSKEETLMSILKSAMNAGINTMFNQSYLDGLSELFASGDVAKGVENMLVNLPSSFVPTAFQQVARIVDTVQRDTYANDPVKKAWNKMKAKVPFLSMTLPAAIGADGKEIKNFQGRGTLSNAFESVLSPGYIGQDKSTNVDKEVSSLFERTGDSTALPNWSAYTTKGDLTLSAGGKKYTLTIDELKQFQKTAGAKSDELISKLLKGDGYKNLDDESKASIIRNLVDYANDTAKREYIGDGYENDDYSGVYEAEKAGVSPTDYYMYKTYLSKVDDNDSPSQLETSKALEQMNINQQQKGKLWEIQNGESEKNPYTGSLAQQGLEPEKTIAAIETYEKLLESVTDETAAQADAKTSQIRASYIREWLTEQGYNSAQITEIVKTLGFAKQTSKKSEYYVATHPLG